MRKKTFEQLFAERNPQYVHLLQRMREAMGVEKVSFEDINTSNLRLFRDHMKSIVSANSLVTYFAVLKATIAEMAGDGLIQNPRCTSVLRAKTMPSQHCALTEEELTRLDEYTPRSDVESDAKILFMRGAYSGARSCDCAVMGMKNVTDGTLTYVSKKTKTGVTQPLHKRLQKYLLMQPSKAHSRSAINYAIQAMCRKLGMTEPVTLSRGGRMVTKPKWQWITQHCSRRSYVTALVEHHLPIAVVSKLAGHSSTRMTDRYVCTNTLDLPADAMAFFDN